MDFLYFLVKGSSTYGVNEDPMSFLKNYFETEGAFNTSFIYALVVALVGLLLFYGIFGMKIYKLATKTVYWITAGLVSFVTLVLTQLIVVGTKSGITGFFASVNDYFSTIVINLEGEQLNQAMAQRQGIEDKMDGFCSAVMWLDITNAVVAFVIFFLLSLMVKNITTHAKRIPF